MHLNLLSSVCYGLSGREVKNLNAKDQDLSKINLLI